jgi:hypothetical protein
MFLKFIHLYIISKDLLSAKAKLVDWHKKQDIVVVAANIIWQFIYTSLLATLWTNYHWASKVFDFSFCSWIEGL